MQHPIIKKTNRLERIFIIAALIIVGLILSLVVSTITTFASGSFTELSVLRIAQISSQIFTFVLPPILYVSPALPFCQTSAMPLQWSNT